MKKGFLILLLIAFTSIVIFAESKNIERSSKVNDQNLININQCSMYISNFGIFGQNNATGNSGFWWPTAYSSETYIFGAGIWVGALVDTGFIVDSTGTDTTWLTDTLVSCGYNPNSGATEFVPGDIIDSLPDRPSPYTNPWDIVYMSTTDNNGNEWPVRTSSNGDSIISEQDSYCEYNDKEESAHFTAENKPLNIEIHQTTYGWTGPILEDIIFIKFDIRNDRDNAQSLKKCYIGIMADNDIGNESGSAANDLLGFIDTMTVDYNGVPDTLLQMNVGYQFQLEEEVDWSHFPAIIEYDYLQSPKATESVDLYHDGTYIIPAGERIGMTSFNYSTIVTDPATKEERYQMLAGYDHISYNPSDPEDSYKPFPTWGVGVDSFPGQTENPSYVGDKRFMMSSGPFELKNGEKTTLVVAIIMAETKDEIVMKSLVARQMYDSILISGVQETKTKVKKIENPAELINFNIKNNAITFESNELLNVSVYDVSGRSAFADMRVLIGNTKYSYTINVSNLKNGIYILNTTNSSTKISKKILLIK